MDWNTTYSIGIRKMPKVLAASIPANTGVPTARRLTCAAPLAVTSGTRPRMKAMLVIITARNRVCAPSRAASFNGLPASRCSLANSTMRMPFLAASAISTTRPICAYKSSASPVICKPTNAPRMPTLTDSSTGTGITQLSYSATRNR